MTKNGRLPANLSLGPVHLTVTDLDRSLRFYQERLGLQLIARQGEQAALGAGGPPLLQLTGDPDARRPARATGLYHFAILLPSRRDLAHALHRLSATRTAVQGFADHLVSEAIYLADPDGNGIELYRDRPRAEWHDEHGRFRLDTLPLDLAGLLAELGDQSESWSGPPPGTVIGHVHLHVRDIPEARRFYCDQFGFELMMDIGSALFVAAGGYHHHLGLNVWGTQGAPPPPPGAVGLRHFTVALPDQAALDRLLARLQEHGIPVSPEDGDQFLNDPAGNRLRLVAAGQQG